MAPPSSRTASFSRTFAYTLSSSPFSAESTIFLLSSSARARAWTRRRSTAFLASCSRISTSFAPSARAFCNIRSRSAKAARRISSTSERPRPRTSSTTDSSPMPTALGSRDLREQLQGDHEPEHDDRFRESHQDQAPPEQLGFLGHRPDGRPADDLLRPCGRNSCPRHPHVRHDVREEARHLDGRDNRLEESEQGSENEDEGGKGDFHAQEPAEAQGLDHARKPPERHVPDPAGDRIPPQRVGQQGEEAKETHEPSQLGDRMSFVVMDFVDEPDEVSGAEVQGREQKR